MTQKNFEYLTWGSFTFSILLPIAAWGSRLNWELGSLNGYQWFPLLGMLAWMIMWGHFITGAIRVRNSELMKPYGYSKISGYIVLACLLLHPGILAFEQARNGAGIPPQSFFDYVGEDLKLAVMLGSVSLIIFLSFEFFDRMKSNKTVKKIAPAISISQSLAMILIFIHAVRLGSDVMSGWFKVIWVVYGLALLPSFYIIHKNDFKHKDVKSNA